MVSNARVLLAGVGFAAAAGLLAGCSAGPAPAPTTAPTATETTDPIDASPSTLTFVAYGGAGQDAMIAAWQAPFTAEHPNVTFVNTSPPDVAQVKAQVDAGQIQWDILATSPAAAQQNCGTLFERLDFSGVDESELVPGTVGDCYIGNFINATPFAYRTDAFPDPSKAPKTIEDFFNVEKFPGQRGVLTNLQNGILEYGLLGDGADIDSLYPLDVDRSLAKWATIRANTLFAPNVGALQQAVAAGQVDMFLLADSRLVPTMNDGMDITIVWDKTVASINAFAVPLGSKNVKVAEAFLSTVVLPDRAAAISEALGVAPVNTAAKPNLKGNAKKVEVFGAANTGETVVQDIAWYARNFNEATAKLTTWLAG